MSQAEPLEFQQPGAFERLKKAIDLYSQNNEFPYFDRGGIEVALEPYRHSKIRLSREVSPTEVAAFCEVFPTDQVLHLPTIGQEEVERFIRELGVESV